MPDLHDTLPAASALSGVSGISGISGPSGPSGTSSLPGPSGSPGLPSAPRAAAGIRLEDDDFTLFGLPRAQRQERALIDERWRALQARVHPDRFAAEGAAAQRLAMQWAVRVNEAYRRLKDPLQRAMVLCELAGHPVRTEGVALPAPLLMQQMAWRESLEEADGAAAEALDAEVAARQQALQQQLQAQLDEARDAAAAAATVRELMFVTRFRDDIARRLDEATP